MISVCTVLWGSENFIHTLTESIISKSKLITELLVADHVTDKVEDYWVEHLHVRRFAYDTIKEIPSDHPINPKVNIQHALGLHSLIDKVTNPYIMFTDPDVFFILQDFDSFYLELMNKYNLSIIGIKYTRPELQGYQHFVSILNCMMKTIDLPSKDFLKGKERGISNSSVTEVLNDYYLCPGCPSELAKLYPFPTGKFDTGSNLYAWFKDKPWLAFGHLNMRLYITGNSKRGGMSFGNMEPIELPFKQLLWHQGKNGCANFDWFNGIYQSYKVNPNQKLY